MSNQALYWIALGILTLGLNGEYQKGRLPLAHSVVNRAEAVVCTVAAKAEQTWVLAKVLTGQREFRVDDALVASKRSELDGVMAEHQAELDRAMAQRQADLDRIQEKLDRLHMVIDRAQVEKLRKLELVRFKVSNATNRRIIVCPQTGRRISVNSNPAAVMVDTDDDVDQ
jgi:hypothetical protein